MTFESSTQQPYTSDGEIEEVVRRFESCAFTPSEFGHRPHLTVAIWYLTHFTLAQSHERMRDRLQNFLRHHSEDLNVYHETITIFWLKLIQGFLDSPDAPRPLFERANRMLQAYNDSTIIYRYYTKARLMSDEARTTWVEPDLETMNAEGKDRC